MNSNCVSIITRTKDRELLLSRAISSILKQTHRNWLHIIVNDGGDITVIERITREYIDLYDNRLKIIHNNTSLGAGQSLNIGMKAAVSEYVVVHDDDDTWESNFLEKSIVMIQTQKKFIPNTCGIVTHSTLIEERIDGLTVSELCRYSFNGWLQTISLARLCVNNFIPPISFLFERVIFEEIGFFNESLNFGEDWEFYLRVLSKYEIAVLKEHLANYHQRPNSINVYGNTVIVGIDKHILFGTLIRNELLRKDISSGKFGIGCLVALLSKTSIFGGMKHELWRARKRFAARFGVKAFIKRTQLFTLRTIAVFRDANTRTRCS